MRKAILDTAEVIHDYMRNGDRSTSREECITWIARLIQEVSQQSPSATVDVKRYSDSERDGMEQDKDGRWVKYDDIKHLLHSQQPTVDVDALFNKHRSAFGDFVLWVGFKNAITEALRGTYAREDMIAFGNACVEECSARASMPKRDFIPIQKLFEQFIEQRNSK